MSSIAGSGMLNSYGGSRTTPLLWVLWESSARNRLLYKNIRWGTGDSSPIPIPIPVPGGGEWLPKV